MIVTQREGCVVMRCCSQNFAVQEMHIDGERQTMRGNIDSKVNYCPFCGHILTHTVKVAGVWFSVSGEEFKRLAE